MHCGSSLLNKHIVRNTSPGWESRIDRINIKVSRGSHLIESKYVAQEHESTLIFIRLHEYFMFLCRMFNLVSGRTVIDVGSSSIMHSHNAERILQHAPSQITNPLTMMCLILLALSLLTAAIADTVGGATLASAADNLTYVSSFRPLDGENFLQS